MSSFVSLLILLPVIGAIVSDLMRRSFIFREHAWAARAIAAGLVLVAAWALRPLEDSFALTDWLGGTVQDIPLVLMTYVPGIVLLIAWASIHFYHTFILREQKTSLEQSLFFALIFVGMIVAALASNFVTLLVGVIIVDLAFSLNAMLRGSNTRVVMLDFSFNCAATVVLLLASVLRAAGGNTGANSSFYFPYAPIGPALSGLVMLALVLRSGVLPFRNLRDTAINARRTAGRATTLILATHLSNLGITQISDWAMLLLIVSAVILLGFGLFVPQRSSSRGSLQAGSFFMALTAVVTRQPALIALSGVTWLLGIVLVNHPDLTSNPWAHRFTRLVRSLGVLCLIGVPLTVGFPSTIGVLDTFAMRPDHIPMRNLLLLMWGAGQTLLTASALRVAAQTNKPDPKPASLQTWILLPDLVAFAVVCVPALLLGMAPRLVGLNSLGQLIGGAFASSWLTWGIGLLMGVLLWRKEQLWQRAMGRLLALADRGLAQMNTLSPFRNNWRLQSVLPFFWNRVALLWLGVVTMLTVFVIRFARAW